MASQEASRIRAELFPEWPFPDRPIAHWRSDMDDAARRVAISSEVEIATLDLGHVDTEVVEPRNSSEVRTIFYCHGGGFAVGSSFTYRALTAELALRASAKVVVPNYRLAPEHRFPAASDDVRAAYSGLLEGGCQPEHIVVAGDSAGAALAVALMTAVRDAGEQLPAGLILISPWLDLTLGGESYRTRRELDPIDRKKALEWLVAMYVDEGKRADPTASPAFTDYQGFPPTLIQVGDHEVLLSDATSFHDRAIAAGVSADLEIWPEMWHVWHSAAPSLPEASAAIDQIGQFTTRCFEAARLSSGRPGSTSPSASRALRRKRLG